MTTKLEQTGAISVSPGTVCGTKAPSCVLPISLTQFPATYLKTDGRVIASPAPAFLDLLMGTGVGNARYVVLHVTNGSLVVRMTTAGGTDQTFTLSDLFILSSPQPLSGITALAVQGTATLTYLLAGDAG